MALPPTMTWSTPSSPKLKTSVLIRISSPCAGTSIAVVVRVASNRPIGAPAASVVGIEVARRSPTWCPSESGFARVIVTGPWRTSTGDPTSGPQSALSACLFALLARAWP